MLSSLLSAAAFAFWNPSGRKTLGINVIDMAWTFHMQMIQDFSSQQLLMFSLFFSLKR